MVWKNLVGLIISCLIDICLLVSTEERWFIEGTNISLECGNGQPQVSGITLYWLFSSENNPNTGTILSQNLVINDRTKIDRYSINRDSYSLHISQAQEADAGGYECRRAFADGFQLYAMLQLRMYRLPLESYPTCQILNADTMFIQHGTVNQRVHLLCRGGTTNPLARLRWFQDPTSNGNPLTETLTKDYLYYSRVLEPSDNGRIYMCELLHPALSEPRRCTVMPLTLPPTAVIAPSFFQVTSGQSVMFDCRGEGRPYVQFNWDTQSLRRFIGRYKLSDHNRSISISELQPADNNATVTCVVTTPNGLSSEASAVVLVVGSTVVTTSTSTPTSRKNTNIGRTETSQIMKLAVILGLTIPLLVIATGVGIVLCIYYFKKKGGKDSISKGSGTTFNKTEGDGEAYATVAINGSSKENTVGPSDNEPNANIVAGQNQAYAICNIAENANSSHSENRNGRKRSQSHEIIPGYEQVELLKKGDPHHGSVEDLTTVGLTKGETESSPNLLDSSSAYEDVNMLESKKTKTARIPQYAIVKKVDRNQKEGDDELKQFAILENNTENADKCKTLPLTSKSPTQKTRRLSQIQGEKRPSSSSSLKGETDGEGSNKRSKKQATYFGANKGQKGSKIPRMNKVSMYASVNKDSSAEIGNNAKSSFTTDNVAYAMPNINKTNFKNGVYETTAKNTENIQYTTVEIVSTNRSRGEVIGDEGRTVYSQVLL